MRGVIEHFVTFLFILMFVWVGMSYIMQNIVYSSARDYHSQIVKQIEDSNYHDGYIQTAKEEAAKAGFTLTVNSYTDSYGYPAARVELLYNYIIPFSGVKKDYHIFGYTH